MLSSKIKAMIEKPVCLLFILSLTLTCLWVSCVGKPPVEIRQIPEELPRPEAEMEAKPEPELEQRVSDEFFIESLEHEEPGFTEEFHPLPEPAGLVFIPADPPVLVPAPGVGIINRETMARGTSLSEEAVLRDSFRAAYVDGLLKELPLAGVLGGDRVHGWPDTNPSGWVQNWRSTRPVPNSWGIPSLILAIRGVEITQDRVFVVDGEILNYYGTSAGLDGANGDIGYGSPRGEKFFYDNGIAQRFERGLIVIDGQGQGSFLPEEAPSSGLEPLPDLGNFPEVPWNGKVREAFVTAWKMTLDRGIEMVPDGPGQYLSGFSRDPVSQDAEELKGLYIQTFNGGSALLILPEVSGVPLHARFLGSPFLEVFLSPGAYSLPGTEGLKHEEPRFPGGDDFTRRLMGGISFYGFPLTDPIPYRAGEDSPWHETQRFSKGWLRTAESDSEFTH
jgi:hypothetical protein